MRPEIGGPGVGEGSAEVEVLELGEGEEGGCREDVDAEEGG